MSQKVFSKWKAKVTTDNLTENHTKNSADEPPRLEKLNKKIGIEEVVKNWRSKGVVKTEDKSSARPWNVVRSKVLDVRKNDELTKLSSLLASYDATLGEPSSCSATLANRPSQLQSKASTNTPDTPDQIQPTSKRQSSGAKTNWQRAVLKTSSINSFDRSSSCEGK